MNKYLKTAIIAAVMIAVLAFAFLAQSSGDKTAVQTQQEITSEDNGVQQEPSAEVAEQQTDENVIPPPSDVEEAAPTAQSQQILQPEQPTPTAQIPQPTETVLPPQPVQQEVQSEKQSVCTLSVSCASVLNNMGKLKTSADIIPPGGTMLAPCEIAVNEGESVFDVLVRASKEKNIRMEHNGSSAMKNAYIEGIGNLYEFDCGAKSGWLYKINGEFQSMGCSNVLAHRGDIIEFVYTCDMGYDVGGGKP